MSRRKIIIVIALTMLLGFIAFIATSLIRTSLANDEVADYLQSVENIRNYPQGYDKGATADTDRLLDAIKYDDENYQAYILYAQSLHNERKYDAAIKFYQKTISIAPDSIDGYWYRSQCYAHLKKYDKAIADMTKCVQLDPTSYSNYFARARLYGSVNNRISAIRDYDEIINREDYNHPKYPSFALVLNNKAFSLMELGKYYEALPLLNHAISLQQNDDTFYGSRGQLYYAVGDFEKSYNDFNRAIRILEKNKNKSGCDDPASYYYYRGLLHSRLGLAEAARVDLQLAVQMGSVKAAKPLHQIEQVIGKSLIENI
ncbi:tetratricopeptide repeat protein [Hymenobacter sp. BT683]|uniref:Tetratricopeptide repeat protein n=1 Tax=Hymenobacter jeongseonensis TaxID=2791027 RepID=A0ABS0IMH3_9BACT|nr:tetratricopeptide repeat protein [Hymenobacter jeongseonensis]MBF9239531.1 tetratricopeptide repeat protein [Hymenobacter jeongseonensis]